VPVSPVVLDVPEGVEIQVEEERCGLYRLKAPEARTGKTVETSTSLPPVSEFSSPFPFLFRLPPNQRTDYEKI